MIAVNLSHRRYRGSRKRHYFLRHLEPSSGKVRTESYHTTDKKTAEAIRQKPFRDINGLEGQEQPDTLTIDALTDLTKQYMRNRDRAEGSMYLIKLAFHHFREFLIEQGRPLSANAVTPETIEAYITHRRAKAKARTVNREVASLRTAWNRGIQLGRLTTNPFKGFERIDADPVEIKPITPDEERKLLAGCVDDLELECWVRLLMDTGCRANEVSHLKWADLDLGQGIGTVSTREDWRSKTRRSRHIAFTPETAARLSRWRLQRPRHGLVFGEADDGPREHYCSIVRRFRKVIEESGLRWVTPQDCRRTLGSRLAARGVNQKVISTILGHSNISTTAKYYQNVDAKTIHGVIVDIRQQSA